MKFYNQIFFKLIKNNLKQNPKKLMQYVSQMNLTVLNKKHNFLFIYPNDQYGLQIINLPRFSFNLNCILNLKDFRITDAIEITKKYQDKIEIHVFPQNQQYNQLVTYDENLKSKINAIIMPNQKDGIIDYVMKSFKNINWIQAMGTGIDKLLANPDLQTKQNIILTNLKTSSDVLLSEFAIGGIFYFSKKFKHYINLVEKKQWVDNRFFEIEELEGKTILIVGLGSIGKQIAQKSKFGFNMKVFAIKRNQKIDYNQYSKFIDELGSLDKLTEYCSKADFIVNCLPTIPNVKEIYTKQVFDAMKKNAIFVNVARGVAVNEQALIEALLNNKLLGAALDVVSKEPLDPSHPFYSNSVLKDKVLMTCHSQDKGKYYEKQMCYLYEENLQKYLNNQELRHIIDKNQGY